MADVNYNGKTVSDENVKTVLGRVATELNVDVNVSSGDRDAALDVGAGTKSLHLKHQAADFHLAGTSDERIQEITGEERQDFRYRQEVRNNLARLLHRDDGPTPSYRPL